MKIAFQYAGILGVDPRPFTLRELALMVDGRGLFEWGQVSQILAMICNIYRKPGTPAVDALKLNPFFNYEEKQRREKVQLNRQESLQVLQKVFMRDKNVKH